MSCSTILSELCDLRDLLVVATVDCRREADKRQAGLLE
jgi:hypothetical protein